MKLDAFNIWRGRRLAWSRGDIRKCAMTIAPKQQMGIPTAKFRINGVEL